VSRPVNPVVTEIVSYNLYRLRSMMTNPTETEATRGRHMRHDITILGQTIRNLPLNRAMLELSRRAVGSGILPSALELHVGTPYASSRWTHVRGRVGVDALRRAVRDPRRWFLGATELMFAADETWALTNQWSWVHPYGSTLDDLERVQRLFPQLALSWTRY